MLNEFLHRRFGKCAKEITSPRKGVPHFFDILEAMQKQLPSVIVHTLAVRIQWRKRRTWWPGDVQIAVFFAVYVFCVLEDGHFRILLL